MLFCNLETERLLLKNIGIDDRDFIFSQFSDDVVNRYLFDAEPLTDIQGADDIIRFYIQPEPRPQHRWIIIRKADDQKIGTCGFHCWNAAMQITDIGYDLKEAYWRNGYMQEALREIIAFAKEKMNVMEISACIYIDNVKSIRLVERMGFVFTGKSTEFFRNDAYIHNRYSLYL